MLRRSLSWVRRAAERDLSGFILGHQPDLQVPLTPAKRLDGVQEGHLNPQHVVRDRGAVALHPGGSAAPRTATRRAKSAAYGRCGGAAPMPLGANSECATDTTTLKLEIGSANTSRLPAISVSTESV